MTFDEEQFKNFYRPNVILHLTFFLFSAVIIGCSFAMTSEGQTTVEAPGIPFSMPQTCLSRRVWGIDCPGCGLTRSFISMSDGKFRRAFGFNAAGPLVYAFVLVQLPWHLYQIFRIKRMKRPVESIWLYSGLFVISAATFLQWIWRFFAGDLT